MDQTPRTVTFTSTMNYKKLNKEDLVAIGMAEDEISAFLEAHQQYVRKRTEKKKDEVKDFQPPPDSFFVQYENLSDCPADAVAGYLKKVVVIKFNGGLGTNMGLNRSKASLEIRNDLTFLDIAVRQVEYLKERFGVEVPLILMNSFHTDAEMQKVVKKYENRIPIFTFCQSKFPRLDKATLEPSPRAKENLNFWYPPGSGDIFRSFHQSGLLDKFLQEGKEYAFISNIENVGGVVGTENFKLIQEVFRSQSEFISEVAPRLPTDVLGGILVQDGDIVRLLELSQVPADKMDLLKTTSYKYWNTNSMWVKLETWREKVQNKELRLDVIGNARPVEKEMEEFLQLESPAVTAIKAFKKSEAIVVPRRSPPSLMVRIWRCGRHDPGSFPGVP
eukprot:TRINITY_DN1876_c0_g1_i2.p1 TRINITY_DN1876_c0_g1~~TRINITY_DN1876_c0_g1_i2.p1  ORF type:complete len:389 (-),score=105.60 TRINITY_DN1876_c0_g1_i2:15-1181(-)